MTLDGAPAPGVAVTVDGPGGPRTLTTDAEGRYFLDALPAGTWTITLTVPGGTTAAGATSRTVTITSAGEVRGGQDFALTTSAPTPTPPTPTPTTAPTPTPTASTPTASPTSTPTPTPGEGDGGGGSDGGTLPDTGGPPAWLAGASLLLVAGGLLALAAARRSRSS